MAQSLRTTITLLGLALVVVLAAAWGWSALTEPLPAKVDSPVCVTTPVAAGAKVHPQQVTVSVYNAGQRAGLAGRTMQLLTDQGFPEGSAANARSAKVANVEIWTTDPKSPAVQLVASFLPKVKVREKDGPGPGVTVVVGDRFDKLAKGQKSVVAAGDTEICSPPID